MENQSRKIKSPHTRQRVFTVTGERKTKCVQSEKHHSDINNIVAKAYQTKQLPVLMGRQHVPDFPSEKTYQDMLNQVVAAQQQFERLPSEIRAHFDNKPQKMLSAIEQSKKNPVLRQQLADIGLVNPPPALPAKQSGSAASGGEATAQPVNAPVDTPAPAGEPSNA